MKLIRGEHKEASSIGVIGFQDWEQSEEQKNLWEEKLAYCKKKRGPERREDLRNGIKTIPDRSS